jgi:hypothetical protein
MYWTRYILELQGACIAVHSVRYNQVMIKYMDYDSTRKFSKIEGQCRTKNY